MINENVDIETILEQIINENAWLWEKAYPVLLFVTDNDGMLLATKGIGQSFIELDHLEQQDKHVDSFIKQIESSGYLFDHLSTPMSVQQGMIGLLYQNSAKDTMHEVLRYINQAYSLKVKLSKDNSIDKNKKMEQQPPDIRDVLVQLLFDTNFSSQLDKLTVSFIEYLKKIVSGEIALFLFEKQLEQFLFEGATDPEIEANLYEYTISFEAVQTLFGRRMIINADDWEALRGSKIDTLYSDKVDWQLFVMPLKKDQRLFGLIFVWCSPDQFTQAFKNNFIHLVSVCERLLFQVRAFIDTRLEGKQYQLLYQVTKKFHSSMDVNGVLKEIIMALKSVYPSFVSHLLLSNDSENYDDLPVKHLKYLNHSENVGGTSAYLTGKIQFENRKDKRQCILYAPMNGKQGVYGVLEVVANDVHIFPQDDVEFIKMLANTAGNALENAKLYQQSQRSISDLQLINQASHRLNSSLRLTDTISYMTQEITDSFQAEEVGFVIFKSKEIFEIMPGSTTFFADEDRGYQLLERVATQMQDDHEAIFYGDFHTDSQSSNNKFRSLMAVPMMQNDTLIGMVLAVHSDSYHFTFDEFKLLQSLVSHSTLALTNSVLREELEHLVITDQLTKLYSRSYLDDRIARSMEEDTSGLFILIDIDDFKTINDTYGHQVGDQTIIQVANIMLDNVRDRDIAARWGGEELAIYLPNINKSLGLKIATRLLDKVQKKTSPRVTISCGLARWSQEDNERSIGTLFRRADQALYSAKNAGKNQVDYL